MCIVWISIKSFNRKMGIFSIFMLFVGISNTVFFRFFLLSYGFFVVVYLVYTETYGLFSSFPFCRFFSIIIICFSSYTFSRCLQLFFLKIFHDFSTPNFHFFNLNFPFFNLNYLLSISRHFSFFCITFAFLLSCFSFILLLPSN